MGLNESEIEEQGIIDAIKRGIQKGKEFIKNKFKKGDNDSEEVIDKDIDNTQEPIETGRDEGTGLFYEIYPTYTVFFNKSQRQDDVCKPLNNGLSVLDLSEFCSNPNTKKVEENSYRCECKIQNTDIEKTI